MSRFEFQNERSSPNLVKITVMLYCVVRFMSPDFLKKCQMQPISKDQWQIAKFILEFKSTHPTGIIFDGIKIGWIFSLLKDLFHNVLRFRTSYIYSLSHERNMYCFSIKFCGHFSSLGHISAIHEPKPGRNSGGKVDTIVDKM